MVSFDAVSSVVDRWVIDRWVIDRWVIDRWVIDRSDLAAGPAVGPAEAVDRWAVVSLAANPAGLAHCADVLGDNVDRSSSLRSTHGLADD